MKLNHGVMFGFIMACAVSFSAQQAWCKEAVSPDYSGHRSSVQSKGNESTATPVQVKKSDEIHGRYHPKNDWLGI